MSTRNTLISLGLGGIMLAGLVARSDAAVGIYYIGAANDSMWGYDRASSGYVGAPGAMYNNSYGSTSGGSYLTGTWNFNNTSTMAAPAGAPGFRLGTGMADGLGTLTTAISSDGISASALGNGQVQYDSTPGTGTDADTLYANGTATLSLNFAIPAGGPDYTFKLTGTASADPYSVITVRLAGQDALGHVTTLIDFETDGTQTSSASASWTNQSFVLAAGSLYALDLYVNPNFPYANATYPDAFSATSQFNIVGTFVPEPTAFAVLLGGAALTLRRRRRVACSDSATG